MTGLETITPTPVEEGEHYIAETSARTQLTSQCNAAIYKELSCTPLLPCRLSLRGHGPTGSLLQTFTSKKYFSGVQHGTQLCKSLRCKRLWSIQRCTPLCKVCSTNGHGAYNAARHSAKCGVQTAMERTNAARHPAKSAVQTAMERPAPSGNGHVFPPTWVLGSKNLRFPCR